MEAESFSTISSESRVAESTWELSRLSLMMEPMALAMFSFSLGMMPGVRGMWTLPMYLAV